MLARQCTHPLSLEPRFTLAHNISITFNLTATINRPNTLSLYLLPFTCIDFRSFAQWIGWYLSHHRLHTLADCCSKPQMCGSRGRLGRSIHANFATYAECSSLCWLAGQDSAGCEVSSYLSALQQEFFDAKRKQHVACSGAHVRANNLLAALMDTITRL